MNILFVCNSLGGGGAEKLLSDLLPVIKSQNNICDVFLLTNLNNKYDVELKKNGIRIFYPNKSNRPIDIFRSLHRVIKDNEYDIVHVNLFPSIYYCSILKKIFGHRCPALVMTEHSTNNGRRKYGILRHLEKWIYKSYDGIISISEDTQTALLNWLQIEISSRFQVINNGIDLNTYRTAFAYSPESIVKNFHKTDILLCMVGSFRQVKNHLFMLDVLASLPDRFKLVLIGEGPLYNEIFERSTSLDLQERITFLGFRSDIPELLKTVDVLVIPSLWEGFGLTAIEGMASGKIVIGSNVKGLNQVIGDGGFCLECNDLQAFVDCILENYNNEEKKEKAVLRASDFDIYNTARSYLNFFRSIL